MEPEVVVVLFFMTLVSASIVAILAVTIKTAISQTSKTSSKSVASNTNATAKESYEILKKEQCLILGNTQVYLNSIQGYKNYKLEVAPGVFVNVTSVGECANYSICIYVQGGNLFIAHWNDTKNEYFVDSIVALTNNTNKLVIDRCRINISLNITKPLIPKPKPKPTTTVNNTTVNNTTKPTTNTSNNTTTTPNNNEIPVYNCMYCHMGPCMMYCRHMMHMRGMAMMICRRMGGAPIANIYELNGYILVFSNSSFVSAGNDVAYEFTNISPSLNGDFGCVVVDPTNYSNISVMVWNGSGYQKTKFDLVGPLKNPAEYGIMFNTAYLVLNLTYTPVSSSRTVSRKDPRTICEQTLNGKYFPSIYSVITSTRQRYYDCNERRVVTIPNAIIYCQRNDPVCVVGAKIYYWNTTNEKYQEVVVKTKTIRLTVLKSPMLCEVYHMCECVPKTITQHLYYCD